MAAIYAYRELRAKLSTTTIYVSGYIVERYRGLPRPGQRGVERVGAGRSGVEQRNHTFSRILRCAPRLLSYAELLTGPMTTSLMRLMAASILGGSSRRLIAGIYTQLRGRDWRRRSERVGLEGLKIFYAARSCSLGTERFGWRVETRSGIDFLFD